MTAALTASPSARVKSLDVLRGVAILGILVMNVQAFAMIPHAYDNPTLQMDFGPVGGAVWVTQQTLFAGKFLTVFAALFGAGLVLAARERDPIEVGRRHRARMGWLLAFGLIHGFGFWVGDILAPYAVAGMIAITAVGWSVKRLLVWAGALFLGAELVLVGLELSAPALDPESFSEYVAASWALDSEAVAFWRDIYRSDWLTRWPDHAGLNAEILFSQLLFGTPSLVAVMFAGMALMKAGFFERQAPRRALTAITLAGFMGWGLSAAAAAMQMQMQFDYLASTPWRSVLNLAAPAIAWAYAAWIVTAVASAARAAAAGRLSRFSALWIARLEAVGRMSFSAYLLSTLMGVLVFFGPPGLGLTGTLSRLEQMGVVVVFWAVLLVVCPMWLRRFRRGPMEALWRWLARPRPT